MPHPAAELLDGALDVLSGECGLPGHRRIGVDVDGGVDVVGTLWYDLPVPKARALWHGLALRGTVGYQNEATPPRGNMVVLPAALLMLAMKTAGERVCCSSRPSPPQRWAASTVSSTRPRTSVRGCLLDLQVCPHSRGPASPYARWMTASATMPTTLKPATMSSSWLTLKVAQVANTPCSFALSVSTDKSR